MKGFAGINTCDGSPVEAGRLVQMLGALRHRGDGVPAIHSETGLALGTGGASSGQTGTLPRDATHSVIASDVRLDNRSDLIQACESEHDASDDELILLAYRKWGRDFVDHLLGDFAFALWDAPERTLICVRDHFGVKPFYYAQNSKIFAFASEAAAIMAADLLPRDLDDASIAGYIEGRTPTVGRTYYRQIRRLAPGHMVVVKSGEAPSIRQYFRLATPEPFAGSDAPEAFLETFRQSVECRLRTDREANVGAMLSGGLDSSAIVCVAAPFWTERTGRPLTTISRLFAREEWSERQYVDAVVNGAQIEPAILSAEGILPLEGVDRILAEQSGPFLAPNIGFSRPIYGEAKARGIDVLLDGHGGDEVVSYGWERLPELARSRSWKKLWFELSQGDLMLRQHRWRLFASYVARYSIARPITGRIYNRFSRAFLEAGEAPERGLVSSELLASVAEDERVDPPSPPTDDGKSGHLRILAGDYTSHAFEVANNSAAYQGVEARYPFWDKRLVELCLSFPAKEKLDGGWSRLVMRRAMEGVLPKAVQWRRDKLNFAPQLAEGLIGNHRQLLDEIFLAPIPALSRYVDVDKAQACYRRLIDQGRDANGFDLQAVWRIAVLSIWLQRRP